MRRNRINYRRGRPINQVTHPTPPTQLRQTTPVRQPSRQTTPVRQPSRQTTPVRQPSRQTTPVRQPSRQTTPMRQPSRQTTPVRQKQPQQPQPRSNTRSTSVIPVRPRVGPVAGQVGTRSASQPAGRPFAQSNMKSHSPIIQSGSRAQSCERPKRSVLHEMHGFGSGARRPVSPVSYRLSSIVESSNSSRSQTPRVPPEPIIKYEKGPRGPQGPRGPPGERGKDAVTNQVKIVTSQAIPNMLKDIYTKLEEICKLCQEKAAANAEASDVAGDACQQPSL